MDLLPTNLPEQNPGPPITGLIQRFKDLATQIGLHKIQSWKTDGKIDWNTHCENVHQQIFEDPAIFDAIFEKIVNNRNRLENINELLLFTIIYLDKDISGYWQLMKESMQPGEEEIGHIVTRWNQLSKIALRYFKQFILPSLIVMIDQEKSWHDIEKVLLASHDAIMDIGQSDRANELLADLFPKNDGFTMGTPDKGIQMCPFTGAQADKHKTKREGKSYRGCLLIGGKGLKGKTALDDFIIVCALIVYRYEMWKNSRV